MTFLALITRSVWYHKNTVYHLDIYFSILLLHMRLLEKK
jgi:hypothetical protein